LEKNGADVGEKRAFGAPDAFLSDESEKLSHDAADIFASAKFGASAKKLFGDGADFGVGGFFVEAFMDDAESGGGAAKWIEAAPAVSGSEAAAIFFRDARPCVR